MNLATQHLEQRANSKELLANAIKAATISRGRYRNSFNLEDLDNSLAKQISLKKLARFESFQSFFNRLREALIQKNIIREDCDVLFG